MQRVTLVCVLCQRCDKYGVSLALARQTFGLILVVEPQGEFDHSGSERSMRGMDMPGPRCGAVGICACVLQNPAPLGWQLGGGCAQGSGLQSPGLTILTVTMSQVGTRLWGQRVLQGPMLGVY